MGEKKVRYICQVCLNFIEDNKNKTLCDVCEKSLNKENTNDH